MGPHTLRALSCSEMSRKKSQKFYREAVKVLRHGFLDPDTMQRMGKFAEGFDPDSGYDLRKIESWTPSQKAKITRYFKEIDKLASRPFKIYRPRKKEHLRAVQIASQHEKLLPGLKVAFVPVADPAAKLDIKVSKDRVTFKHKGITKFTIPLNVRELLLNPRAEIERAIRENPAKLYQVQAGKHLVPGSADAGSIQEKVMFLMNRYGADKFDPNDDSSHYFGNWLHGLVGYTYHQERQYMAYQRAREAERERLRLLRQRERARRRKAWGKKRSKGK